jgi:hypothetical protein
VSRIKDITVLILVIGLMSLLGLIVVDEFRFASVSKEGLDVSVVELLQMAITGIVGIVAGYLSGKSN